MGMPILVRASFMLSGMLGLKLEGFIDDHGKPQSAQAFFPFNITKENQSAMIQMNSNQEVINSLKMFDDDKIKPFPDVHNDIETGPRPSCGPGFCTDKEECVTWIKDKDNTRKSRESPMMFHECLSKDGNHYTKMDPTSGMLCNKEEVYSIIRIPQPCLKDNTCNLVWKYRCVNKSDSKDKSTHNCRLKMCPSHTHCVELVECDIHPPCITNAVCVRGEHIVL